MFKELNNKMSRSSVIKCLRKVIILFVLSIRIIYAHDINIGPKIGYVSRLLYLQHILS
jgi:hypothetical protein